MADFHEEEVLGKEGQVRLALACMLARGHLLIEDLPGVGKTTLAHVLARSLGLQFQRIQLAGGSLVDRSAILSLQSRRDAAAHGVQRSLQAANELGVLVKDLDIGLIDFLTRYHDRDVCLCWRLGEDRIRFWHSTEDGFRGRRRIDEEFLANHSADD